MTIVIVPQHDVVGEPHPVGKLASTLLSVAVAGAADPPRFRRGKAYLVDNAVLRLEISAGVLRASVVGSRATPYEVRVAVQTIPRPATLTSAVQREHIATLAPQSDEMLSTCTCPDTDDPCKHAVAALLALSAALVGRPELLVEWRCGEAPSTPRAQVGSRATGERHLRLVPGGGAGGPAPGAPGAAGAVGGGTGRSWRTADRDRADSSIRGRVPTPPPSPFDTPEWREFEGLDLPRPVVPEIARTQAPVGTAIVDRVDVGDVIRTALSALREFMR